MKKINVRNEAVVPIIAVVLIIAVVIVAGVIMIVSSADGEEYWKTDVDGLGELREYVEVEYEDGEIQQLKILVDNEGKLFATVTYDGDNINKFRYILSAVASGTGYTGVEVAPDDMQVEGYIKNSAGTNVWRETWTSSTNLNKPLGVEFTIFSCEIPIKDQADSHSSWSGNYRCEFGDGGQYGQNTLRYRGTGSTTGDWESVSVNIYKNFYVVITQDGNGNGGGASIILDVDQSYDALQAVQ